MAWSSFGVECGTCQAYAQIRLIMLTHLQTRLTNLIGASDPSSLRAMLMRSTSGVLMLRLVSVGLGFITSLLLARMLDVAMFGAYSYAMSWINILLIPGLLGFGQLMIREYAHYRLAGEWGLMHGLMRSTLLVGLSSAVISSLMVFAVTGVIALNIDVDARLPLYVLWVSLLVLPLDMVTQTAVHAMWGLQAVVQSRKPDSLMKPLLFIALAGGVHVLSGQRSALWVMGWRVVAALLTMGYALVLLKRVLPREFRQVKPVLQMRSRFKQARPFFALTLLTAVHARIDVLMLGAMMGVSNVAPYSVVLLLSTLVSMVLEVANASLAPNFARLYAAQDMDALQGLMTKSTRVVMGTSTLFTLALLLLGPLILAFYGPVYRAAYPVLVVLIVGECINTFMGSVGMVLSMTGNERYIIRSRFVGAVVYIILNALLIPAFGLMGAAMATTLSMFVWNGMAGWFVWRQLKLAPTALGRVTLW